MEQEFIIGTITSTHGLKGEVKVFPKTSDIRRFDFLKECYVKTKQGEKKLICDRRKYFKNLVILGFAGINRIEEIEPYKGLDLYVTRENAVPLEAGEFYFADALDAEVFTDTGEKLGVLYDILETGANLVLSVKTADGRTVLIPKIDEIVKEFDCEKKRVVVHMMKGLMD